MGYYQGDYRGDFYGQGDFGGFLRKAVGFGKNLLGFGGPAGIATRAITRVASFPGVGAISRVGGKVAGKVGGIIKAHPVLTGAGAAGVIGVIGGRAEGMHGMVPGHTKGFHVSRKTGKVVRNRHMNACNPRALRRAIRRAHSFERLAKHVIGFSSPRKPKGHMYFKRKRTKK